VAPAGNHARSLNNAKLRAMRHHVSLPETAIEILGEAGFSVVRQDVYGFHIVTLAKNS